MLSQSIAKVCFDAFMCMVWCCYYISDTILPGKTAKPPRPAVSPAMTKRLVSGDDSHSHGTPSAAGTTPATGLKGPENVPVVMRQTPTSSKKAPPRPKTVAAGNFALVS